MSTRDVTVRTRDRVELAATWFEPDASNPSPPGCAVLLSPGTGIPRYFYTNFAAGLAAAGHPVLTYDYRGIGGSAPELLKGYHATKIEWGTFDMSGAFDRLRRDYPDRPHVVVGHSVGGQLLALMDGVEHIDAVVSYGACFGYWGNMRGMQRAMVWGMWHVGIPALTRAFGYLPAKRLGLGEDLPTGVSRDWARWGKRADYFTREIGDSAGFSQLDAPWLALLATDDPIATRENAEPLYAMYSTPVTVRTLDPAAFDYPDLGHLGFFSKRRQKAWPEVLTFLAGVRS